MPLVRGHQISAHSPRSRRRPKTYRSDRTCAEESCATRLSRYNASDRCYLHAPRRRVKARGEFTEAYLQKRREG